MTHIKNATILVIDDEVDNLFIMSEYLDSKCKEVLLESKAEKALALACAEQPNIILLDICMPEMDGYEVCRHLKATKQTQFVPVIFLSSLMRASDKVKGFDVGAVDYISKPFEIEEVIARIESSLKLHHQLQAPPSKSMRTSEKLGGYSLRDSELKILDFYIAGHSRKDIARRVDITENTVKWYLSNIFKKLSVKSRAELLEKLQDD